MGLQVINLIQFGRVTRDTVEVRCLEKAQEGWMDMRGESNLIPFMLNTQWKKKKKSKIRSVPTDIIITICDWWLIKETITHV